MLHDPKKLELFGGKPKDGLSFKPQPRQDALGNKIPNPEEELVLIEKEIQELKIAFEQHFMGFDRKAPTRRRDVLGERLRKMKSSPAKVPTLVRHRLDQAHSKFQAFDRVWMRTMHEIEAGTYKRDVMRLKNKARTAAQQASTQAAPEAPVAAPPPPAAAAPPLSEGQIRALYDAFVTARRRTNESTDSITYEGLSKSLLKQVPQLMQKYECKAIDFKVVIKDNKAILKAVPRK